MLGLRIPTFRDSTHKAMEHEIEIPRPILGVENKRSSLINDVAKNQQSIDKLQQSISKRQGFAALGQFAGAIATMSAFIEMGWVQSASIAALGAEVAACVGVASAVYWGVYRLAIKPLYDKKEALETQIKM